MEEGDYIPLAVEKKHHRRLLRAFSKGKGATLKGDQVNLDVDEESMFNGMFDEDSYLPLLVEKKHYRRVLRAFNKGRGAILKPDQVNLNVSGSGLFDSIKKLGRKIASSNVGKAIAKEGINRVADFAQEQASRHGMANNITRQVVGTLKNEGNKAIDRLEGQGLFDMAKKVASSKLVKDLGKKAVQEGTNFARKKLAEKGIDNPISNAVLNVAQQQATKKIEGGSLKGFMKQYAQRGRSVAPSRGFVGGPSTVYRRPEQNVNDIYPDSESPLIGSGARWPKGSKEAKDAMRALRAMRKKKTAQPVSGGSFKFGRGYDEDLYGSSYRF